MTVRYYLLVMLDNEHIYFSHSSQEEAFAHAETLEKMGGVMRRVWAYLDCDLTSTYRGKNAVSNV